MTVEMILAITCPLAFVLMCVATSMASSDIRIALEGRSDRRTKIRLAEIEVEKAEAFHATKCPRMTDMPRK